MQVTMSMKEYEELKDRIRELEEVSIYKFVKREYKDLLKNPRDYNYVIYMDKIMEELGSVKPFKIVG